jgi:K+/H+ antiporter YhaU regulatory subunit KhtT
MPKADFVIKDSDILIILGEEKQLKKLDTKKPFSP